MVTLRASCSFSHLHAGANGLFQKVKFPPVRLAHLGSPSIAPVQAISSAQLSQDEHRDFSTYGAFVVFGFSKTKLNYNVCAYINAVKLV